MTSLRSFFTRLPRHSVATTPARLSPLAAVSSISFSSKRLQADTASLSVLNSKQWAQNQAVREFSSWQPRRAYPQYSVFGDTCALSIKCIMPNFKRAGAEGIAVEKRGRLMFEFVPRSNAGAGFMWQEKLTFSMSVEEVGLLLSQLPVASVDISHVAHAPGSYSADDGMSGASSRVTHLPGDATVDKVFTAEPGEGATIKFKLDFVKDGIGGQSPPGAPDGSITITPMEVTLQAGEYEVIKSVCQTSIPYLLGWNTTLDIASAFSISQSLAPDSGRGGY